MSLAVNYAGPVEVIDCGLQCARCGAWCADVSLSSDRVCRDCGVTKVLVELGETAATFEARAEEYDQAASRIEMEVLPKIRDRQTRSVIATQVMELRETARVWRKRAEGARS